MFSLKVNFQTKFHPLKWISGNYRNDTQVRCKSSNRIIPGNREIRNSNVEVQYNTEETKEFVQKHKPDAVVISVGFEADDRLYEELQDEVEEIYKIGDCIKARKFIDATQEAFQVAVDI